MLMKRAVLTAALTLSFATAAVADVTIKQNVSGKGMGMQQGMVTTSYIKGLKMRSDTVLGDTTRTMVFDVENQKIYMFDSKKKEADVFDMQAFGGDMSNVVDVSQTKASFKSNGETKQIAGKTASGYDMSISMPATMGDAKSGMKMNVNLSGPIWIVKGAPGSADFSRFYKGAVEKGFIFMDPRAAKGAPGQAKAMAEMYRQMAEIGGVPYETEMNIKMGGDGPMAGLMAKMGGMSTTSTVQSIETAALGDDLFAPPAGYKLNQRK
ncbi:MAG: hypothetical protein ACRD2N_06590 [Vicinamibacterales bacterium]